MIMLVMLGHISAQNFFTLPTIPDTLRTPELRAEYLVVHYWDNMDFKSSGFKSQETEQAFADFVSVLAVATPKAACAGVDTLMNRAAASDSVYRHFSDLAEKYLYDSASPLSDDNLYALFLQHEIASQIFSEAEKERLRYMSVSVNRNAPGTLASDFEYVTAKGETTTLHQTAKDVPLLLFFYDPSCGQCQDMLFNLRYNSILNLRLREGSIKMLAVYTEDDNELWKTKQEDMPSLWTACTDNGIIKERDLYDLRTMPVLYLLDAEKRVVLKNTSSKAVAEYLLAE